MTESSAQQEKKEISQNPGKVEASERRERILELAKKIGFWNIDPKVLSKQMGVHERTIYKDMDWIKGHYKPEELRTIRIQLDIAAKRAFNKAMMILAEANGVEDNSKAIDAVLKTMKAYREELEEWGIKEKEADIVKFVIERQNERVPPKA
jgi:hypothetical protein